MKLIKDLLLFDIQTTGNDTEKDAIIQLSAVLLDKDNLLEKGSFNAYTRTSILDSVLTLHAQIVGVPFEEYKKSQKQQDVFKQFINTFGTNLTLTTLHTGNILFLKNNFKKYGIPFEYDPHILDIWTLGYVYSTHMGLKKIPTLHTLAEMFNQTLHSFNNAQQKVQAETNILRQLISQA